MRKGLAIVAALMLALAVVPTNSHASVACPGIDDNNGINVTVGNPTGAQPANPLFKQKLPVFYIESGRPLPTYTNPSASDQSSVTGFTNLGTAGCLGYCDPQEILCAYRQTQGLGVATNYLTPQATHLQVIVRNYPSDIDNYPDPGCLRFSGTAPSVCTGTGNIKLSWKLQPGSPFHNDGPRFVSQLIAIPSTATSVNAWALIVTYRTSPNPQKFVTTYTKQA